jgi:RNA polymerase sigma factor (sigma-70 family)
MPRSSGCRAAAPIDILVALPTDEELLEAWRNGDAAAGESLFDRHFASVSRFFRNKVGTGLDDLVQATFMRLVESRERFRGDGSFRSYLFGVAYNVLRRHYRDRQRDDRIDFGVTSVHATGVGPSVILDADREHRRLLEGLRRIPIEHQTLLELYYWESLSAAAIASVLEVPEGTIRTRLRRAKSLLEEQLRAIVEDGEQLASTLARLADWAEAVRPKLDS